MKQNYKAFAPDISTGGTTIKDVGKQRFSRKSSNSSKLWELLICLMAIVMPVGAWAEGDGKTEKSPFTGDIGYQLINNTWSSSSNEINVYLYNVTPGNNDNYGDNHSRIEINVPDKDVILYVAGENHLKANNDQNLAGEKDNEISAIMVKNAKSFTIKHWSGPQDNSQKTSTLKLHGESSSWVGDGARAGLYYHINSPITIDGVTVLAYSHEITAWTYAAPAIDIAIDIVGPSITLKNGAYFAYDNIHKPSTVPTADKWAIENFAAVGGEAAKLLASKPSMTVKGGNLTDKLQSTSLDGFGNVYTGKIGEYAFVANVLKDDNSSQSNFKLLIGGADDAFQEANNTPYYYGEVTTQTSGTSFPFPIRKEGAPDILPEANIGAASSADTYLGQINQQTNSYINLNVANYPHTGELTASTNNISLIGNRESYQTMLTGTGGFTLGSSDEKTLTLESINIPTGCNINIKDINSDVRLGEKVLGKGCTIADDVIKYGGESVYYCLINYSNTNFDDNINENATIKLKEGSSDISYPYTVDSEYNTIHAWLPQGKTLKITKEEQSEELSLTTTKGIHYQEIFAAPPVVYILKGDHTTQPYDKLSEAFKVIQDGQTIYLEGDYKVIDGGIAAPESEKFTGNFTLDLNGHTLDINSKFDKDGNYPLISSRQGKLTIVNSLNLNNSGPGGEIKGDYRIEGLIYTELSLNPHIEGIEVKSHLVPTDITANTMPDVINYNIGKTNVKAAKKQNKQPSDKDQYCLWVPQGSEIISPVEDAAGTIFAQIKKDKNGNSTLIPLFDLNSYDITVETDVTNVTKVSYANGYEVTGFGTSTAPAEIVTVAEDNYNTKKTLTVNGDAHVILKDIYTGLQTGDGKVDNKNIETKLVVNSGTADIKTSGINSIGTIEIAQNATLKFNQLVETPATANALRFFSINDANSTAGTLVVEGGSLLAYLNVNDTESGQINVATATYKAGSVRAKFADGTNRFRKEGDQTELYRTSFKVKEYYTPYEYNILDKDGKSILTGKATSDKNGEIHLWLPHGTLGGTAKFKSANQTTSEEEIVYSAVAENDNNIAPASIGLYPNGTIDVNNKIGSFNSLGDAFKAMETNKEYTVVLYTAHTESNTTCAPTGSKVTIDLNGMTLNCHNVTFKTNESNFMLITNTGKSSGTDDDSSEKHATISGDITVSQNVYIGKNVHMEGIHVDMINPTNDKSEYKNVRRLLVKGLEFEKTYTYEFAEEQIVRFTVKQREISATGNNGLACLWLVESMYPQEFVVYGNGTNAENGLTVPGGELAIVAHSNGYTQLQPGGVVAEVNGNKYRTLSKAIDAANDPYATNRDIKLLADIQSQATFNITQSYAIDLNGHDLTFTQGGFNATGKLTIKDGSNGTDKKGILAGVIKLISKENVSVDPAVTIGGVVVDASQATPVNIYRLMVDGDVDLNTWVETPERDTDKQYDNGNGTTYEYTIPAGLANHSTTVKGYKVVVINGNQTSNWDANSNVIVKTGQTWTIQGANKSKTIHRLTIEDNGKVDAQVAVTATDGIRYVRTFEADKWSLIALPFTATDITKKEGDKVVSISPAADPGTSGHFWLHTIKNDGSTTDVTDSEMTANKVYVMKVPNSLLNQEISFVSGPNQMLRRDKVLAPDPISGFVAYANGTLNEVSMDDKKYYYTLEEVDGEQMFVRKEGASSKIAPFSGYLLADVATANTTARFSLRSTPTANEEIEIAEDELQIRTEAGRIILTTEMPVQVVICDLKGTVKFSGEIPAGDSSYEVGAGIYIINNQKVIVK